MNTSTALAAQQYASVKPAPTEQRAPVWPTRKNFRKEGWQ